MGTNNRDFSLVFLVLVALLLSLVGGRVESKAEAQVPLCGGGDVGTFIYLHYPDSLMRGIRAAEGVPSYGVLYLKQKYGSHASVPAKEGRAAAAKIVHDSFRKWRAQACPGTFADYLAHRYAPVGARNDPYGLNKHWQANVLVNAVLHAERKR